MKKLLFVCSRNRKRSLTAEQLFKGRAGIEVRSAGTAAGARIRVSETLLRWADLILVMEKNHKNVILETFPGVSGKTIKVLGIPDEYELMDAELIEILEGILLEVI